MGILHSVKKISGVLFFASVLVFSGVASFLSTHTALAAGESYKWLDSTTIQYSGGLFKIAGTVIFSGSNTQQGKSATNALITDGSNQCTVPLLINLSGANSGIINAGFFASTSGNTSNCSSNVMAVKTVNGSDYYYIKGLDGNTISISGTRGAVAETTAEKQVNVFVYYNDYANRAKAPKTITITATRSSDGKKVSGTGSLDCGPTMCEYITVLHLDPGTYNVCASAVAGCKTLTKKIHIAVAKFELNQNNPTGVPEDANQRVIDVALNLDIGDVCNKQGQTVGPYAITLQQNGNVIQTVQTDTAPISTFGCGSGGTITSTSHLTAQLKNVDPGTYQVCVGSGSTICKTVTKVKYQAASVTLATTQDTADTAGGTGSDNAPSCENTGFSMAWIMCKIIDGLANTVDGIYSGLIMPMLKTPDVTPASKSGNKLFNAWSSFRTYGDVFLVIALLVVVFGQTIGGGLVDAYTVKRALPRILAAAVLINLSYYLVEISVDLSNIIGRGIEQLMTSPFGLDTGFDLSNLTGGAKAEVGLGLGGSAAAGGLVAASFVAGAGGIGAALGAAMSILWSVVLLPVLLVFFFIMLTLIIRVGLIYALILLSPVAFALYALPNTEQYFRRWWDTLFRTLLIFPIISVLFGLSKIMAQATIWGAGSSGIKGGFAYILALVILVAPLLGIPFAFRLAGGIIGRIHDLSTGARGKLHNAGFLKRGRDQALQQGKMNVSQGANRAVSSFGNTALGRGISRAPIVGGRMRKAVQGADQRARMLASEVAKDPRAQAIQDDDHAIQAQTYANARAAYQGLIDSGVDADEAQRAVDAAKAANGFGRAQAINAVQRMIDTGTAFNSGDIEGLASTIARASGGNASTIAGLAGYANAKTKQVGRHDLAPSFGALHDLAMQEAGLGSTNATTDAAGNKVATTYQVAAENAWNSASLYQHANDKPQNIRAAISHFTPMLNATTATGAVDTDARERAAIFFHELKTMQPNASGEVRNIVDQALTTQQTGVENALNSLTPSLPSPSTGRAVVDPTAPLVQNPTTGEFERPQIGVRGETARERVERRSRAYERVDPNRL